MRNILSYVLVIVAFYSFTISNLQQNAIVVQSQINMNMMTQMNEQLHLITDKATVTSQDLTNIDRIVSETGVIYDYSLEIKRRIVYADKVEYIVSDTIKKGDTLANNTKALHQGDIVTIKVKRITKLNSERLLELTTGGLSVTQKEMAFTGMVR